MIAITITNEKVIRYAEVDSGYQPKSDEVLIEEFPPVELQPGEIARIFYRNGKIEYEIEIIT